MTTTLKEYWPDAVKRRFSNEITGKNLSPIGEFIRNFPNLQREILSHVHKFWIYCFGDVFKLA